MTTRPGEPMEYVAPPAPPSDQALNGGIGSNQFPVAAHPIPSICPLCGAYSLAPEGEMSQLLAVCNVLVVKALDKMGNFIIRAERSRFNQMKGQPAHTAHTLWPAPDAFVDKALKGAWDVVPALLDVHGCCDVTSIQVTTMLDQYVHDLAITGTAHTLDGPGGLMYRFQSQLGLPVYWHAPHPTELILP